jgi:hypothetical protein
MKNMALGTLRARGFFSGGVADDIMSLATAEEGAS